MSIISDKQEEMYQERLRDTNGYFREAITESEMLKDLRDAFIDGHALKVVDVFTLMQRRHNYPSQLEAEEELIEGNM